MDRMVELIGGGSVINGPTPSSFKTYFENNKNNKKKKT